MPIKIIIILCGLALLTVGLFIGSSDELLSATVNKVPIIILEISILSLFIILFKLTLQLEKKVINWVTLVLICLFFSPNTGYSNNLGTTDSTETIARKSLSPFQKSLIELGSIYAVRTVIYSQSGALQDNDFSTWGEGILERVKSKRPYRFDDNSLAINHLGHALMPAYETALFRTNGMGFYQAFALQSTASTFWEFVVEAKETVSLNDVLETPVAGASISEVLFQFAQFYRKGAATRHNKIMGAIFSGPMAFNYWVNGTKRKASERLDMHGFDANSFHSFKNYVGSGVYGSNFMLQAGTEMNIINIKAYKEPGTEHRFYNAPVGAEFALSVAANPKSVNEVKLLVQTLFATYHSKNIGIDSAQQPRGSSFLIGAASGYEINYAQFPRVNDNLITVHVLGLAAEWFRVSGKTQLRAKAKLYGDYASVSSQALDNYVQKNGALTNVKSSFKQGYYHAIGTALLSEVELKHGKFLIGGKLFQGQYSSVDGYDRHQEEVLNDFHLTDMRTDGKAWISFLPSSSMELQLGYEQRLWKSTIDPNISRNEQQDMFFGRVVWMY